MKIPSTPHVASLLHVSEKNCEEERQSDGSNSLASTCDALLMTGRKHARVAHYLHVGRRGAVTAQKGPVLTRDVIYSHLALLQGVAEESTVRRDLQAQNTSVSNAFAGEH